MHNYIIKQSMLASFFSYVNVLHAFFLSFLFTLD